MDKKNIQSILWDVLEDEIPSETIKLWPAVKADLVAGQQQGEKMNITRERRITQVAFGSLVIIALLTAILLTPPGRAFAQNVIQFFIRIESTSFELTPSQIVTEEPDPAAPTAAPPAPLISVAEAEAQAGFDAAELPAVPEGFNYLGARLYGDSISIEYQAHGYGGNLILMQSRDGFNQSEWDQVPEEAIVPVKIGELEGEFVKGMFVVFAGETSAAWNPEAPILRLRWMKDGIWFEMTKFGDVDAIEYLDQAGMIALAESIVYAP